MVEMIQEAYSIFEQLHLSVTGLLVAAVVFSLAFLFAVREAASWFFKVDDVKRDVRRLHEVTTQLEGEIKLIQNILMQIREPLEKRSPAFEAVSPAPKKETAPLTDAVSHSTLKSPLSSSSAVQPKAGGFPINH